MKSGEETGLSLAINHCACSKRSGRVVQLNKCGTPARPEWSTGPPYVPSLDSLNRHPLPQWYGDAKLGIFVHWGLYSVPGWAPLVHPEHDFTSQDYITQNPYAEWYLNTMRLEGSPTQAYHREPYGADYNYYNFAPTFNREIQKWNPDSWAEIFRSAGAKYVVLTTKH